MIIQGGNEPIVIQFDPEIPVTDMQDISCVLCIHSTSLVRNADKVFKRWNTEDVVIDTENNLLQFPLTQEETMEFQPGKIGLEMKWLSRSTGYVRHLKVAELEVGARCDEEVLV